MSVRFHQRKLPHYERAATPHFVNFSVVGALRLTAEAKDIVFQHCMKEHDWRATMHACVVMGTHVHLLLTPLSGTSGTPYTLSTITKGIKGTAARKVNQLLGRKGPLWQEESWDRVSRNSNEFAERLSYIQENPVAAGLVRSPHNYKWLWIEVAEPSRLP